MEESMDGERGGITEFWAECRTKVMILQASLRLRQNLGREPSRAEPAGKTGVFD